MRRPFSIHIDQLRPRSRGSILLKSLDPNVSPALHFNYLSAKHDLTELVEGVNKARDLVAQASFDDYRGEEIVPGPDARSEDELKAVISKLVGTDYHPCGTCRMGNDSGSVVDPSLRVHGVQGLRVVDASVMPNIISGNLNGPVQMIALRATDFILGRTQLEPFYARFHFQDL